MSFPPANASAADIVDRILLVDDDPAMLENLELILEARGLQTILARSGGEGLTRLREQEFNLALLDIGLPDMSGTDLLSHFAAEQPDAKCIMVTGNTELQAAVDALNSGAYAYIRKPFEVPDVEAVVLRALNEQRVERANRVFASLSRSLVENLDLDRRLELVAAALRRITGVSDCALWLRERESLQPALVPEHFPGVRRRLARFAAELDQVSPQLREALESGAARVVEDPGVLGLLPDEMLERWGSHRLLLLPLHSGGRVVGVAALSELGRERPLPRPTINYAETVANMAAVALQQARTVREERETLAGLAQSFQTEPPVYTELEVASRYEPAAEVAKIGGDYFDFIEFDAHCLGVVIGDVCGKGLQAAVYTGKAKDMLRAYALEDFETRASDEGGTSPRWVLSRVNRALCRQMSDMFVTMVYGVLDSRAGTFTYTNAGHPHPVVYLPQSDQVLELTPGQEGDGPINGLVGAVEQMEFSEQVLCLEPGTVLAFVTDGVTEARTGLEMLEVEGVRGVVREHARESADTIAEAIYRRVVEFAGGVLRDDVAIVVIKHDG